MHFPVALASYSFHGLIGTGQLNLLGYLELLASRYDVRFADIWTGLLPADALEPEYLKKIRQWMDDRDIALANLCVDGPYLWHADEAVRNAHRLTMLDYLKAAEILGARTVRIDFGGDEGPMPDAALDVIVRLYREYCGICHNLGMRIGPENHWGWDRKPEYLRKVRDAVDHPAYGHLLHVRSWPEPAAAVMLDTCLPILMHTHLPADIICWSKPLIRKIADSGYQGAYSIEHHSGQHELERSMWQLSVLRSMIAELRDETAGLDDEKVFYIEEMCQKPVPDPAL
ncbi:MAG: TIM barrel protein [Ruminococcaceae bacterium]|nr:TIM barrel protein [Oscillospiraceae bacterium]